eukprot:COSAG01_NODE_5451_length_4256_cov_17.632908_4_plen_454_part_00
MPRRAPSTVAHTGEQASAGKHGSSSRQKLSKKGSVQAALELLRSLFRGSALRQLSPLAALAVASTALKHFNAVTQGQIFGAVFLGDSRVFVRLLARNLLLAAGTATIDSTKTFAEGTYALRWRTALTTQIHDAFFSGTVYYRLAQLDRRISNPGDRIAGDVPLFTQELSTVVVEGVLASTDAAFFLWQMRKTGGFLSIWAVLGYVTVAGGMVFGLAPNLSRLHGKTRELEGTFRGLHARLSAWAESIAFASGEDAEARNLGTAFNKLKSQTEAVLWRTAWYRVIFDFFVKYVATTFAVGLIIGPFFGGQRSAADSAVAKAATLTAMRYHTDVIIGAFTGVGALAGAGNQIAQLGGYAGRIMHLLKLAREHAQTEAIEARGEDGGSGTMVVGDQIGFNDLTVTTPTGVVLAQNLTLHVPPGKNLPCFSLVDLMWVQFYSNTPERWLQWQAKTYS